MAPDSPPAASAAREDAALWREAAPRPRGACALLSALWRGASLPRTGVSDVLAAYALDGRDAFTADLGAGLVVAIMLIPQALAYASLAGMPAVTGFFAAILALFTYPLFGSSGHQAVGPVALMSLLAHEAVHAAVEATAVAAEGAGASSPAAATQRFAELSYKLAFLVGVIQTGMGLLRAGYLIHFLSHPVLGGFTSASAIIIASSQLPKAFGFAVPRTDFVWQTWHDVAARVATKTHALSLGLFCVNVAMFWGVTVARQRLMAMRAVKSRPALVAALRVVSVALVVVVFNTLLSGLGQLDKAGLSVLGRVPSGMPTLTAAALFGGRFASDLGALLPSATMISIVSYVESASVAKAMQNKYGVAAGTAGVQGDRELLGLGLANVAVALFGGFPVTGGFSRSSVNAEAGARTVMAGVITGSILCLVVSFATSWFYYLPDVTLAAMIVFSSVRLLEAHTVRYLLAVDWADATVWLVTLVGRCFKGDTSTSAGASIDESAVAPAGPPAFTMISRNK